MDFSALTRRDFTRCNPLTNNPVELFGITRRTSRVTRPRENRNKLRDVAAHVRVEFGNSLEARNIGYFECCPIVRFDVVAARISLKRDDPLIKSKLVSLISNNDWMLCE